MKTAYGKLMWEAKQIKKSEDSRKQKPVKRDYVNVVSVLRDFGIRVTLKDIPKFNTKAELDRYRRNVIFKGEIEEGMNS